MTDSAPKHIGIVGHIHGKCSDEIEWLKNELEQSTHYDDVTQAVDSLGSEMEKRDKYIEYSINGVGKNVKDAFTRMNEILFDATATDAKHADNYSKFADKISALQSDHTDAERQAAELPEYKRWVKWLNSVIVKYETTLVSAQTEIVLLQSEAARLHEHVINEHGQAFDYFTQATEHKALATAYKAEVEKKDRLLAMLGEELDQSTTATVVEYKRFIELVGKYRKRFADGYSRVDNLIYTICEKCGIGGTIKVLERICPKDISKEKDANPYYGKLVEAAEKGYDVIKVWNEHSAEKK